MPDEKKVLRPAELEAKDPRLAVVDTVRRSGSGPFSIRYGKEEDVFARKNFMNLYFLSISFPRGGPLVTGAHASSACYRPHEYP